MSIIKIEKQESFFQKEINYIIKRKSKNPILKDITIVDVKFQKNNNYIIIYWTVYLSYLNIENISISLEKSKSFYRNSLAKVINKYKVPKLIFKYDDTNNKVKNIEKILFNIRNKNY